MPWSTLIALGKPYSRPIRSRTSTTSADRKPNRGSIAGENRVNVSTTVSTRIFRPVADWSWTKSIAQISFARTAGRRSSRSLALTRRFGGLLRSWSPNSL